MAGACRRALSRAAPKMLTLRHECALQAWDGGSWEFDMDGGAKQSEGCTSKTVDYIVKSDYTASFQPVIPNS